MDIRFLGVTDPRSRLFRGFVAFARDLYRTNAAWVPPFEADLRAIVGGRHPLARGGVVAPTVLLRDGRIVGRLVMSCSADGQSERCAAFHALEAIDDEAVWDALVRWIEEWAINRGASAVVGPLGLDLLGGDGLLVDGFDRRAAMTMMPVHHRWYAPRLEERGFVADRSTVSMALDAASFRMPERVARVAALAERRSRFTVEAAETRARLRRLAPEVGALYNGAFAGAPNEHPLPTDELARIARDAARIADPRLCLIARDASRTPVGFLLAFPDLSAALQAAEGVVGLRLLAALRRERRRARHLLVNGLGVVESARNRGVTALLYRELERRVREYRFTSIEMVQIGEENGPMISEAVRLGGTVVKRHRVYRRAVPSASSSAR